MKNYCGIDRRVFYCAIDDHDVMAISQCNNAWLSSKACSASRVRGPSLHKSPAERTNLASLETPPSTQNWQKFALEASILRPVCTQETIWSLTCEFCEPSPLPNEFCSLYWASVSPAGSQAMLFLLENRYQELIAGERPTVDDCFSIPAHYGKSEALMSKMRLLKFQVRMQFHLSRNRNT